MITTHTPPANQGQIVEISYGWNDCRLYRCTYDSSDRTIVWEILDQRSSDALPDDWHPVNGSPSAPADAWQACPEPL